MPVTSLDPDTDATPVGADADVPADVPTDAPASGVREADLPPPATDGAADAENDDVSADATSR